MAYKVLAVQTDANSVGTPTTITAASAPTAALTTITYTSPGTPDYAIQNLTTTTPYGFVSADEGNTVLKVIENLQTRLTAAEDALQAAGLMA